MPTDRSLARRSRLLSILAALAVVVALVGLAMSHAGAGPARDRRSVGTAELRAKVARQGRLRVLATLSVPYDPEPQLAPASVSRQRAAIQAATDRVLAQLPAASYRLNATYQVYPLLGLSVDAAALDALLASPDVRGVTESRPLRPSDLESNIVIGADVTAREGYTGAGYVVVVLDTGVQTSHPFLAGKTVAEACFSRTQADDPVTPDPDSTVTLCPNGQSTSVAGAPGQAGAGAGVNCAIALCQHGTHVAGIALGKNYAGGPGFDGVAPGADLIAIQVFSQSNDPDYCHSSAPCLLGHDEDLLAALQYAQTTLAASFTIASVNMSLGDDSINTAPCDSSPYFAAVAGVRALNIATVIAAGNEGQPDALASPACVSNAISVGSTNKADAVSYFSNRAGYMSLFAPGENINSSYPNSGYALLSGTSMATPHVAGAWAVMRQRYPAESVSQILDRLRSTGHPIAGAGLNIPRIQLDAAAGLATPVPTLTPTPTPIVKRSLWLPAIER